MERNGFKVEKLLGKGSYGTVYKVRRVSDGKFYAIKEVNIRSMTKAEREEALNEIRLLASVYHPNITGYFESFHADGKLFITTEFAERGDLADFIKKKEGERKFLAEDRIWSILIQTLLALKVLHDRNILHRDIKAANIFLSGADSEIVKLGDLGVAKLLKRKDQLAQTSIGTPYYISPEIWNHKPYDGKSDVWSLGCLFYELCTYRHPFNGRDMNSLAAAVRRGSYKPLPARYSEELRNLIKVMLELQPARRPSVDKLLNSRAVQARMTLSPTPMNLPQVADLPEMRSTIKPNRHAGKAPRYTAASRFHARGRYNRPVQPGFSPELPSPAYDKRERWAAQALNGDVSPPELGVVAVETQAVEVPEVRAEGNATQRLREQQQYNQQRGVAPRGYGQPSYAGPAYQAPHSVAAGGGGYNVPAWRNAAQRQAESRRQSPPRSYGNQPAYRQQYGRPNRFAGGAPQNNYVQHQRYAAPPQRQVQAAPVPQYARPQANYQSPQRNQSPPRQGRVPLAPGVPVMPAQRYRVGGVPPAPPRYNYRAYR